MSAISVKIYKLPEPKLAFGGGNVAIEPRRALPKFGPADNRAKKEIRIGIVGADEDVLAAKVWFERINSYLPAKEGNTFRYRDWPGAEAALGAKFIFEPRFMRAVDQNRFDIARSRAETKEGFEELIDLYDTKIAGLFGDVQPDVIVVCLPEDIADLRVANPGLTMAERRALEALRQEEEDEQLKLALFTPTPEELEAAEELRSRADDLLFRTFYRALKGRQMLHANPVPLQVLRRDTVDRLDDKGQSLATRMWNLATVLYYKAGGLPWRPADLAPNICFVGISFHHMKRGTDNIVYASVAQAFSTDVEPFALKGATIPKDQRRNKQPFLTADQAEGLLADVLSGYEARAGVLPSRVVIHKTSTYAPEEEEGFRAAAAARVPACDLIWIRSTPFRLVRKGTQEPVRGTLCVVGEEYFLFTSGYVEWWKEYPGPHIPAPIEIGSAGPTDMRQRAFEILALSKMNWNSTDGMSRSPITLSFARKVGLIMSELSDNQLPNPSYKFYT
jgi:hypothetical protein